MVIMKGRTRRKGGAERKRGSGVNGGDEGWGE